MKTIDEILRFLKEEIEEETLGIIKGEGICDDTRIMRDLGVDSLGYATIMLAGEVYVSSKVPEDSIDWSKVQTVRELAEVLYRCQEI